MKSDIPLISICIPTYNGEKYLQEALDSVKAQTYRNIEVIISDDDSKDRTLEIGERFKNEVDFPVYLYNHEPAGIGDNWNYCIEKAHGEYVKFLFQDDILMANCLEIMLKYLLDNRLEIVISKRNIIDEKSQNILEGDWFCNYHDLQKPAGIDFKDFIVFNKRMINKVNFQRFIRDNIFGEPCVSLFSKKLFNKVGRFSTSLKQCLDYVYFLRVLKTSRIGIIEEKLVSFRIHSNQTSNVNFMNQLNESEKLIRIIYNLFFFTLSLTNKKILLRRIYPKFYYRLFSLRYKLK